MKKWILLFGIAVGFVLGSKVGRGPYEQIEGKAREVGGRPEVQKVVNTVKRRTQEQADDLASTLHDRVNDVADRIGEKLPSTAGSNGS